MAEPKYTCILDGCDRPAYRKRMCTTHKARVKKYGSPARPCTTCGQDLPLSSPSQRTLCDQCNVCKVDGCSRPRRRRGYCNTHSTRVYIHGSEVNPCRTCGEDIPVGRGVGARYCSDFCRERECSVAGCSRATLARGFCKPHYRRAQRTGNPLRPCQGCGKDLPPGVDGRVRFCGDECRPRCTAPGCREISAAHDLCSRHANLFVRHGGLPPLDFECAQCGATVRRNYADRQQTYNRLSCDTCEIKRQRKHGWYRKEVISGLVPAECGLCGESINLALTYPDLRSLSIDHIVPITRGGTNKRRNLQPAHLECNYKKRNWIAPPIEGVLTLF